MSNLYNRLQELCDEKGVSGYRMCKDVGIQPSIMIDLKMGRQASMEIETARKVADYFSVTIGYPLGGGKEKTLTQEGECEFELSPAFFHLRQGLEPYDISKGDTNFPLDVYKAHIRKNNQG